MKHKIVNIFSALHPDRKERVKIDIALALDKKTESVKKHWLLNPKTPIKYQDAVLQILEKELQSQINDNEALLEPSTAKPI